MTADELPLWKLDRWGLPDDVGPAFEELRTLVADSAQRPHDRGAMNRMEEAAREIANRLQEAIVQFDEDEETAGDPHWALSWTFIWLIRDGLPEA